MALLAFATPLSAAPVLRLSTSAVVVQVGLGANASAQAIQATNAGDGTLALSVSVAPGAGWLYASVQLGGNIVLAFFTASLPRGTYTAIVTVSDPIAIDAPQTVTVTVQVGESPPPYAVDEYVAPGSEKSIRFYPAPGKSCPPFDIGYCPPTFLSSTQDGGRWLSVLVQRLTTIDLPSEPIYIHLAPVATMAAGAYFGQVAITNSGDDHLMPVTMCVTTDPIAVPSQGKINLRLAQGSPPITTSVSLANSGMGSLAIGNVVARGAGIHASTQNDTVTITVNLGSFAPGVYNGSVTIHCNAANCPIEIPVDVVIFLSGACGAGSEMREQAVIARPHRPPTRQCGNRPGLIAY